LDLGGREPGAVPPPPPGSLVGAPPVPGPLVPATDAHPRAGWTGGRITALVIGIILALVSVGLLVGGGAVLWADRTQRDTAGYLVTDPHEYRTGAYALTVERVDLGAHGPVWAYPAR